MCDCRTCFCIKCYKQVGTHGHDGFTPNRCKCGGGVTIIHDHTDDGKPRRGVSKMKPDDVKRILEPAKTRKRRLY